MIDERTLEMLALLRARIDKLELENVKLHKAIQDVLSIITEVIG